ncbi:hypothetical protein MKK63_08750 [Methylobacterium sp. J-088]|uniref:hypothetical protein n=1 Tax=Methylobacterium sp. J-088 TaxID=2836664 RepID=UPI001FB912C9|nr:hypothetical protein [Methylobacterium sp. J-088]MCJ2062796.1 hypothetical protein [Methylobacterium sp. J-088]
MPIHCCDQSWLVRIVASLSSEVALDRALPLRFASGTMPPWCEATTRGITAIIGSDRVSLDVSVAATLDDDVAMTAFTMKEGGACASSSPMRR